MLEIRELVKIYKTKGGGEVRALDGVSAVFPERGMVFLLGKSGSGKSTLLNVCGGLDAPDSGEIIIKGRSSKSFSRSDFDSYRNTFVGFVFQEYNILNEFSVEDNIALALELQGRGRNREEVAAILEQVELADFAKRKPNTLSGGQKQRVAIARALVKNPQIIMADEPTGALDSATGRQVLETLKKLSAEKLVIVVSHDREFAEIYGDRIIELMDGKIIADVTKNIVPPTPAGDNLTFVGDDTITIKSGTGLTQGDLEKINEFLRSSPKDLIISCGEREITSFKKAARIDDSGGRERFDDTDKEKIEVRQYTAEESAFIRSRLPFKHAVRIGASGLAVKPLRLAFTILLSFIAFTFFGLFSTLTFYDPVETAVATYQSSDYAALPISKAYNYTTVVYEDGVEQYRYASTGDTKFTPADFESYTKEYGAKTLAVFNYGNEYSGYKIDRCGYPEYAYYQTVLGGFALFDAEAWKDDLVAGSVDALTADDIVISTYLFDSLKASGLSDSANNAITLNSYADIVGKTLTLQTSGGSSAEVKVAGVFRMDPPDKYTEESTINSLTLYEFEDYLKTDAYLYALVDDSFYAAHESTFGGDHVDYGYTYIVGDLYFDLPGTGEYSDPLYVYEINSLPVNRGVQPEAIYFFDGRQQNELSDGEFVLSVNSLCDLVYVLIDEKFSAGQIDDKECGHLNQCMEALRFGIYNGAYPDAQQIKAYAEDIAALLAEAGWGKLDCNLYVGESGSLYNSYTAAGFYYYPANKNGASGEYFSAGDFKVLTEEFDSTKSGFHYSEESAYTEPADAIYSNIIVRYPASESGLRTLIDREYYAEADGTFINIRTSLSESLKFISSFIAIMEVVFLWVGIVMAAFAMLLLFNFISVSITYKKKEIGILRAVGARSTDVFKIFYSEAFIIAAICLVLAVLASVGICFLLNSMMLAEIGASIFVFGPLSFVIMLAIAIGTSVIATFLPVFSIARKRPVDSIRSV